MDPHALANRLNGQIARYLADFTGKAAPAAQVLPTEHADDSTLRSLLFELDGGTAHIHDLGRGYKVLPSSPPGVLFQYIVHRANNLEGYDSFLTAQDLDDTFKIKSISNPRITLYHLYTWLSKNPQLFSEAIACRDNLQKMLLRGIGIPVKTINSTPHVALLKGENSPFMGFPPVISPCTDLVYANYGANQFPMWVPLLDLWYSYPLAPNYASGVHGHDNEWLISNKGPRYKAEMDDIKPSWVSDLDPETMSLSKEEVPDVLPPIVLDDIQPEALAATADKIPMDQLTQLGFRGKMDQTLFRAFLTRGGNVMTFANLPFISANIAQAIASHQMEENVASIPALHNPNLTPGNLVNLILDPNFIPVRDFGQEIFANRMKSIFKNPAFNEDVANELLDLLIAGNLWRHIVLFAQNCPAPVPAIHRFFLGALGGDDSLAWSPEAAIAQAFHPEVDDSKNVPTAFNNSQISEQYLRAFDHYYSLHPDEDGFTFYQTMLTGARLSERVVADLVVGKTLAGIDDEEFSDLLNAIAEQNPHLSPRAMIHLIKDGCNGLLRRDSLPEGVQLAIVEQILDIDQAAALVEMPNLSAQAAEALLHRIEDKAALEEEEDVLWVARRLASRHDIPAMALEKFLSREGHEQAAKEFGEETEAMPLLSPLQHGIVEGLQYRRLHEESYKLLDVPVGA
jgi:hypothetical protein